MPSLSNINATGQSQGGVDAVRQNRGLPFYRTAATPEAFRQFNMTVGLFITVLVLIGAGCSTPPKIVRTDPEIERNVAVAHSAYAAGAAEKAAIYYQKALQRARVMDSPSEI